MSIGDDVLFDQIAVLSLVTGEQRILIEGSYPRVTSSGHLVFARDGTIWAAPFDRDRLEVTGTAVRVLEDIRIFQGDARLSIAKDSSMVYQPGSVQPTDTLVWRDLDGSEATLPVPPDGYKQPRISSDGDRVVLRRGLEDFLWVYSLKRNTFTRLTEVVTYGLLWSPDSKKIAYTPMGRSAGHHLYLRNADGTGVEERLTTSARRQYPNDWSRDGREVLYVECDIVGLERCDLGRLTLMKEPSAQLILETEFNELSPELSPDGRSVAYESNRSGRYEIYVRPYPDIDSGLWKISIDGGKHPVWSPDGRTLYYSAGLAMNRHMMSVAIETKQEFVPGDPQLVFDFTQARWVQLRNHDLHPDGERFLMVRGGLRNLDTGLSGATARK